MKDFKVGDEVKWNGDKSNNLNIDFTEEKEEFLKSKEVHTITKIKDMCNYQLLGDNYNWYDLTWLDLVEGEKDE